MFPRSELDNYKLQVELLQEKLQKSEISRQQLEQKLDKILQKRNEHEKLVRSKARVKYQQFLEEQQQRNDRNKQLVMMLERIEQQTEVLNARSERLKMMKLHYEMYFAKLVHAQTRRCIQNSVQPVGYFMCTSSAQPAWSAVQQSAAVGHNYVPYAETTPLESNNTYQDNIAMQKESMPIETSDIHTLTNFGKKEKRKNCIGPKKINIIPSTPSQQSYKNDKKTETVRNICIPGNLPQTKSNQKIVDNNSGTEINANTSKPSLSYLLSNIQKLPESKANSNIPNLAMMPPKEQHTLKELPKKSRILSPNNDAAQNNYSNVSTTVKPLINPQGVIKMASEPTNEEENILCCPQNDINVNEFNIKLLDAGDEIEAPDKIELKNNAIQYLNTSSPSSHLEIPNSTTQILLSSSRNKNNLQKQATSIKRTESEFLINNREINSSVTPVSIENIENEIYGELLSPLKKTQELISQETFSTVPNLLESLLTQSEKNENAPAETQGNQGTTSIKHNGEYDNAATNHNNADLHNYEQNATNDDFSNVQQSEKTAQDFSDQTSYENVDNIDERQQQYDYSSYDPVQYTYPGYVYDETTGEYKPDPNVPLEQYATDQEYAPAAYQQYEQQDYDYNQTYTEESNGFSTNLENTVNKDYDIKQKESSSSVTNTDTNVMQQEILAQTEPIPLNEVSTLGTPKVVKPASILSSVDKTESQKKKKRVNFVDSSETDESAVPVDNGEKSTPNLVNENLGVASESDFDFSSSVEAEAKST